MIELLLIGLVIFVTVMAIAFVLTLRVAARWSRELLELKEYGVAAQGRVTEKRETRRRGATSRWMRYEYVDQFGKSHRSRRNIVTPEVWEKVSEDSPIDIVYSERRPAVSFPKYLMDLEPPPPNRP